MEGKKNVDRKRRGNGGKSFAPSCDCGDKDGADDKKRTAAGNPRKKVGGGGCLGILDDGGGRLRRVADVSPAEGEERKKSPPSFCFCSKRAIWQRFHAGPRRDERTRKKERISDGKIMPQKLPAWPRKMQERKTFGKRVEENIFGT